MLGRATVRVQWQEPATGFCHSHAGGVASRFKVSGAGPAARACAPSGDPENRKQNQTGLRPAGRKNMNRRELLSTVGAVVAAGLLAVPATAFAQSQKEMVAVVKIAGIPWFNAVEKGIKKGGQDFGMN